MVSFRQLLRRLKDHEVDFIIIGGVAAHLLGSPMSTLDVNVCAPLTEENLTRILASIRDLHPMWRFRPDHKIPVDSLEQFRGFKNLYIDTDIGVLDVLGELPGIGSFDAIRERTEEVILDGTVYKVLDIDTLIAAKQVAGREKDRIGIDHLREVKRQRETDPEKP